MKIENHATFSMVNMASGVDRGRVRPKTKNDVAQHGG